MSLDEELVRRLEAVRQGGRPEYHAKLRAEDKLFARERLHRLLDPDSMVEEGALARCADDGLPADAVVTVTGKIGGRPVCVMANDMTVKAGTWGRTEYNERIDIYRIASDFLIDAVVPGRELREELRRRFDAFAAKPRRPVRRWNGVIPG